MQHLGHIMTNLIGLTRRDTGGGTGCQMPEYHFCEGLKGT